MKNELSISNRVMVGILTIILVLGTCLFAYSCTVVKDCRSISSYYPEHRVDQAVEVRTASK